MQQKPTSFSPNFVSMQSPNGLPRPMEDVDNIVVQGNSAPRQKRQIMDLDELLGNSPPWPPVCSPHQNNGEDDRELGSGEWVDKLMVNRLDPNNGSEDTIGRWEANSANMSDILYQKYISDSSKFYPWKQHDPFSSKNKFVVNTADGLEEVDAATSDSSEPDLLWQFNPSKLGNFSDGNDSRVQKPDKKQVINPEIRTMIPKSGPSPSRKTVNGAPRNGRQTLETHRYPQIQTQKCMHHVVLGRSCWKVGLIRFWWRRWT